MKHFICLTTSYPQDAHPLAGTFVQSLNQVLINDGWMPKVVTVDREDQTQKPRRQANRQRGRLGEEINLSSTWGYSMVNGAPDQISSHPLLSLCTMPLNAWYLARMYRDISQKLQNLHHISPIAHWAVPCGWIARQHRPIIYCHGGDLALLERLPLGAILAQSLLNKARGIVCVSDHLKDRFVDLVGPHFSSLTDKIYSIPMGIDQSRASKDHLTRYQRLTKGKLVLATVGRFSMIKGYHLLVESLGALSTEEKSRLVWIAGGVGPELSKIQRRASQLDVPLVSEGMISPPQRDALYQVCDLFIAPSCRVDNRVEGMPLALREAALNGCQLMMTTLGGAHEILRRMPPDTAIEVQPEIQSIKDAIQSWLKVHNTTSGGFERKINMKHELTSVAQELWSWQSLGPKHLTLFKHLNTL